MTVRTVDDVREDLPTAELEELRGALSVCSDETCDSSEEMRKRLVRAIRAAEALLYELCGLHARLAVPFCEFEACEERGIEDRSGIAYCEAHAAEHDEHVRKEPPKT